MSVQNSNARAFYEPEAVNAGWSRRELERQIASLLYERLAASRDKDEVLALAQRGQEIANPQDVIKDPVILEFLGLPERPQWRELDNDAVVRMTLPEEGPCILAVRYETVLPTPREFETAVTEGRRAAEQRR